MRTGLLTSELAEACGLPYFTVDRYARNGLLDPWTVMPSKGPGSRRRFTPEAKRAVLAFAAFPLRTLRCSGANATRLVVAAALARDRQAGAVLVHYDHGRQMAFTFPDPIAALRFAFAWNICGTVLCLDRLEQIATEARQEDG